MINRIFLLYDLFFSFQIQCQKKELPKNQIEFYSPISNRIVFRFMFTNALFALRIYIQVESLQGFYKKCMM